ncbi:hypothetical protein [Nocardioides allogilvus]|uniref:hypothetical protein n=1 Tax=Nocardioides allogilvus TaxID=2072017 RepID=UPI000D30388F|nr:hypothetical protein [Nocardioides allogilvus]
MTKRALAAVVAGVLIGGGVTAVSPAGAEVEQFAATNWKKIWKKKLQPLADKRYYTKSASDAKYSTKTETGAAFANYYTKAQTDAALGGFLTKAAGDAAYAAKGSGYSKAESDAKFQPVGSYAAAGSAYTKTESDAKYAPKVQLIRGHYVADVPSGTYVTSPISFGVTFSATPTTHYIPVGGVPPAGCSGTATLPNAAPGHLCVFATGAPNVSSVTFNSPNAYGANLLGQLTNTGAAAFIQGNWAARPAAVASPTLAGLKDATGQTAVESGR